MTNPANTIYHHTLPFRSDLDLRRKFMVIDEELQGNMRFGLLLEVLDKIAEETALRYVHQFYPDGRVVTAAIDNIVIRHAADVKQDVHFLACINHVGRSSLEIGIRVEQPGEPNVHIASCYFTMVARSGIGDQAVSVSLPALTYEKPIENRRAEKAIKRREEYRHQQEALQEPPVYEEYKMLTKLHDAQDQPGFSGFLCSRLSCDSWERMYPEQENVPKKIFGGYLIRRAFELSSICSEQLATHRSIIAGVNRINFFHPVRMGDKLHFTSRIVYTNESYICIETGIERISRDRTTKALSNSCVFTFTNVDHSLQHQPVPQVFPTTYAEDARYLAAHRSLEILLRHQTIL